MHVHFEKKLVFLLHPRTASRATTIVLEARGFIPVGGHHQGTDRLTKYVTERLSDLPIAACNVSKFEKIDPNEFDYTCVIRNHFDTLSTWFWASKYWKESPNGKVHLEYVEEWPRTDSGYYPVRGQLWRFTGEPYPNMTILRYENLREQLDEYFDKHGLELLADDEFFINHHDVTPQKPRDGWQDSWNQDAREYVEQLYADELTQLGYSFDDPLPDLRYPDLPPQKPIVRAAATKERFFIECPKCDREFRITFWCQNPSIVCPGCSHRWSITIKPRSSR